METISNIFIHVCSHFNIDITSLNINSWALVVYGKTHNAILHYMRQNTRYVYTF